MDLKEMFMEEFGELSKKIQNSVLQGKIQMYFRLAESKEISRSDFAETLQVAEGELVKAMDNFLIYGVVEEKGDTYVYKGYPSEFKDLVAMFPDRKQKLQDAADKLTEIVKEAEAHGQDAEKFRSVINDVKNDFGLV